MPFMEKYLPFTVFSSKIKGASGTIIIKHPLRLIAKTEGVFESLEYIATDCIIASNQSSSSQEI